MKKPKAMSKKVVNPLEGPMITDHDEQDEPQEHEVEDAVRTMQKADMIKNDSKMMGHVAKHVNKQMTSLKGLKKLASKKALEEQES